MGLDTLAEQQAWLSDLAAAVQGLASQARTHARPHARTHRHTHAQTHTHTHTHTSLNVSDIQARHFTLTRHACCGSWLRPTTWRTLTPQPFRDDGPRREMNRLRFFAARRKHCHVGTRGTPRAGKVRGVGTSDRWTVENSEFPGRKNSRYD